MSPRTEQSVKYAPKKIASIDVPLPAGTIKVSAALTGYSHV